MTTNGLDLTYIRTTGEEIRARLFPSPARVVDPLTGQRVDGPRPYALPTALRYRPAEGIEMEVLLVPERSIQRVGGSLDDPPPTVVRVVAPPDAVLEVDLEFGKEPNLLALDLGFGTKPELAEAVPDSDENKALVALLRAVAGVL